jgi:hypothetical protein
MLKRIICVLISAFILLTSYGSCIAANTSASVSGAPSKWAKVQVERALKYDFIPKRLQGDYQKKLTREEFVSLLIQTLFAFERIEEKTERIYRPEDDVDFYWYDTIVTRENVLKQVKVLDFNFTDTKSEDVKLAYILGFINMTPNHKFEPDKLITKQDVAVMFSKYGSPELRSFTRTGFNRYIKRYTDLNKASPEARDAVNLAFLRRTINGSATEADRDFEGKTKITLDPLGNLTREQAVVMLDNIAFYESITSYCPMDFGAIYLKGCLQYFGDCMGISWEVSNDSVRAVALSDRLKEEIEYTNTASRQVDGNYGWLVGGKALKVSPEAHIAAAPRLSAEVQFMENEQLELVAAGKNVAFDIGFAVFEANNPNYVFEFRFKNNGFYLSDSYGGGKLIPIESKRIK